MFKKGMLMSTIGLILGFSTVSFAKSDVDEIIEEEGGEIILETIIVNVRKRAESLQEIPVSVTTFSAQLIEDADIQSIADISMLTPGLNFKGLLGGTIGNPIIRGSSTLIGEPNVGFFIDGIYQESRAAMDALIGEGIERIEVARGPQNALYGRNTFAGAINYITKEPNNESGGKFKATVGNGGTQAASVYYSGPLSEDKLYYRVSAMHSSADGFYTNEFTGTDLDTKQSNIYSLSLLAYPSDDIEMTFRVGLENTNNGDYALQFIENDAGFFAPLGDFQYFSGVVPSLTSGFGMTPGHNYRNNTNSSFKLEWDLENVTFTSVTGYNNLELDSWVDSDYSAQELRFLQTLSDEKEFSQELRLASTYQSVRWMVGAYFYDLDRVSDVTNAFVPGAIIAPGVADIELFRDFQEDLDENTRNLAFFGSLGFDISNRLSLTVSGRYSSEDKEVNVANKDLTSQNIAEFENSLSFSNFTPKVSLDYQLSDNALIYTSFSKAVKAGGFNLTSNIGGTIGDNERTYDEENSLNYEIGVKSAWLNNRLILNATAFYIDWNDQIVQSLGEFGGILNVNAAETTSKGLEVELFAKPGANWDVAIGMAYTDAKFDKYISTSAALFGLNTDVSGLPLSYSSDLTANASIQYVSPLRFADFKWKTRLDTLYMSEQSIQTLSDIGTLPARTTMNFRTIFENDKYAFSFWVKNLLNNSKAQESSPSPNISVWNAAALGLRGVQAFQVLVEAPVERIVGITASIKF